MIDRKRTITKIKAIETVSRRSNDIANSNLKRHVKDSIISIPEFEDSGFESNHLRIGDIS